MWLQLHIFDDIAMKDAVACCQRIYAVMILMEEWKKNKKKHIETFIQTDSNRNWTSSKMHTKWLFFFWWHKCGFKLYSDFNFSHTEKLWMNLKKTIADTIDWMKWYAYEVGDSVSELRLQNSVNTNKVFHSNIDGCSERRGEREWEKKEHLIVELAPLNNHFALSKHAFCVHIKKSMKFNLRINLFSVSMKWRSHGGTDIRFLIVVSHTKSSQAFNRVWHRLPKSI